MINHPVNTMILPFGPWQCDLRRHMCLLVGCSLLRSPWLLVRSDDGVDVVLFFLVFSCPTHAQLTTITMQHHTHTNPGASSSSSMHAHAPPRCIPRNNAAPACTPNIIVQRIASSLASAAIMLQAAQPVFAESIDNFAPFMVRPVADQVSVYKTAGCHVWL